MILLFNKSLKFLLTNLCNGMLSLNKKVTKILLRTLIILVVVVYPVSHPSLMLILPILPLNTIIKILKLPLMIVLSWLDSLRRKILLLLNILLIKSKQSKPKINKELPPIAIINNLDHNQEVNKKKLLQLVNNNLSMISLPLLASYLTMLIKILDKSLLLASQILLMP